MAPEKSQKSTDRVKKWRAMQRLRDSTPEVKFLNDVIDYIAKLRDEGRADGPTGRLAIIAAEMLAKAEAVPVAESGWREFALKYEIFGAVTRTQSTLVREMALESMEQSQRAMADDKAKGVDIRAGLSAAGLLVKDKPTLDMGELLDWFVMDIADEDHGGLAPDHLRVDEGWVDGFGSASLL